MSIQRINALIHAMVVRGSPPDRKHRRNAVTAIVAVLKLLHVLPKVVLRYVDVRPSYRKFHARPKAFNRVNMRTSTYRLASPVIYAFVAISSFIQS